MQVTIDISERQVKFLQWMIDDMKKYGSINTIEEAIKECIAIAMFDEGEVSAVQERM